MEYIQHGAEGVVITEKELQEGNRLWDCAMVGYVLGKKPGYKAMENYAATVWKMICPPRSIKWGIECFYSSFTQNLAWHILWLRDGALIVLLWFCKNRIQVRDWRL